MKILLYCTKAKPILYKPFEWDCFPNDEASRFYLGDSKIIEIDEELNGKVVAECDFRVEEIIFEGYGTGLGYKGTKTSQYELSKRSCLYDFKDIHNYLKGKNGYAIHIKNLNIFDEPLSLFEISKECHYSYKEYLPKYFNAPQNMCYCWYKGKKYALISIQPKWLCKILNGEKTIEVRKKVLKEMLNDK